jgi:ABC-type multidrug transport system permease subunit
MEKTYCPISGGKHCPDGTYYKDCQSCLRKQDRPLSAFGWVIAVFLMIALILAFILTLSFEWKK